MDQYRVRYRHSDDCRASQFLPKILELALPARNLASSTLDDVQERDRLMFFPRNQLNKIFQRSTIHNPVLSILGCKCGVCKKAGGSSNSSERESQTKRILDEPLITLLAILIYIEHVQLIGHFAGYPRVSDRSLDTVLDVVKNRDEKHKWQKLLVDGIEAFCNLFTSARDMFQPADFKLDSPTANFRNTDRMPFLDDQIHDHGSSGKVFKFNIHPDYLDEEIKQEEWYSAVRDVSQSPAQYAQQAV